MLKAYLSTQYSSLSAFVISKTHIVAQKQLSCILVPSCYSLLVWARAELASMHRHGECPRCKLAYVRYVRHSLIVQTTRPTILCGHLAQLIVQKLADCYFALRMYLITLLHSVHELG